MTAATERVLQRIRSEFLEMPGMRRTLPQAQRLWGWDRPTCEVALRHLVDTRFLVRVGDLYSRLGEGVADSFPPVRMAKADLQVQESVDVPAAARR